MTSLNPEFQKAIVFLQTADAHNDGSPIVWNEAATMDGLQPLKMSPGASTPSQYGPVTSDASNPPYAPGFHTTTRETSVFDMNLFNPNYDVVALLAGAVFNPTGGNAGRIESGMKIKNAEDEQARTFVRFNAGTTADTSGLIISMCREGAADSTHYASPSIFSNALTSENSAGYGGENVTLVTATDIAYGSVAGVGTSGSQAGLSCLLTWRPWNGKGATIVANGLPSWVAIRYHKYDPAFPNQHKISVCTSWDNTVRTLTFMAYGSQAGVGIPVNAPQHQNYNMIGHMILAYDVAAEATPWNVAMKAQGDQWINTVENKGITQYLARLRGPYRRNTGPMIDQTTGTIHDVQGKIANGQEVLLALPVGVTPTDLDVVGGFPSTPGSLAGLWLVSADGATRVPQYIRNWGRNTLNYLNRTTAGLPAALSGTLRFVVTQGAIADMRGCKFEVRNAAGSVVYEVPISAVSYNGQSASAAVLSGGGGNIMSFPLAGSI